MAEGQGSLAEETTEGKEVKRKRRKLYYDAVMTHQEIGEELGIPTTMVKLIEQRALEKMALRMGAPPPVRAHWMERALGVRHIKQPYHCSRCGGEGHSSRSSRGCPQ